MKLTELLKHKLESMMKATNEKLSESVESVFKKSINELQKNADQYGLKIGEKAPNFMLKNQLGETVELKKVLAEKKAVLVFYRGAWCPYCNLQLEAYQNILNEIKTMNGTLIAVHPQTQEAGMKLFEKLNLDFEVLSDPELIAINAYGLKISLPEELKEAYRSIGLDLSHLNANHNWELPVTATFIIDRQGMICHAYTDVDYKHRMEPKDILSVLSVM